MPHLNTDWIYLNTGFHQLTWRRDRLQNQVLKQAFSAISLHLPRKLQGIPAMSKLPVWPCDCSQGLAIQIGLQALREVSEDKRDSPLRQISSSFLSLTSASVRLEKGSNGTNFKCRERVGGFVFLVESGNSVENHESGNDREICPSLKRVAPSRSAASIHPRNRSPEESEKNGQFVFLLFLKRVGFVLTQPLLRLRARETGF